MKQKRNVAEFTGHSQSSTFRVSLGQWVTVLIIVGIAGAGVVAWAQMQRAFRYETTCASNLRLLGGALLQYSQDNDQRLPSPGGKGLASWNDVDETGRSQVLDAYLNSSRQSARSLWSCPSPISHPAVAPSQDDEFSYLRFPRSYGMNTYLRSPGVTISGKHGEVTVSDVDAALNDGSALNGLPTSIPLSEIWDPARTDLLFEGIPISAPSTGEDAAFNGYIKGYGTWKSVAGFWKSDSACTFFISKKGQRADETCQTTGLHPWHGNSNNYLYCDGHVHAHPPERQGWRASRADPGDFYVRHCRMPNVPCP